MNGVNEAETELEKVEETLAMADRVIQISRLEHERLASDLAAGGPEAADLCGPAGEQK